MKVYIAGPMRGRPDWNRNAFVRAATRWKLAGHHPYSPSAIAAAMGYNSGCTGGGEPGTPAGDQHLRHVLLTDVACIMYCDAVALLPGWDGSRGATFEVAVAQFLGLPLYCAVQMTRLTPRQCPWNQLATALRIMEKARTHPTIQAGSEEMARWAQDAQAQKTADPPGVAPNEPLGPPPYDVPLPDLDI